MSYKTGSLRDECAAFFLGVRDKRTKELSNSSSPPSPLTEREREREVLGILRCPR